MRKTTASESTDMASSCRNRVIVAHAPGLSSTIGCNENRFVIPLVRCFDSTARDESGGNLVLETVSRRRRDPERLPEDPPSSIGRDSGVALHAACLLR
jgi:hypothetical protein